MPKTQGGHMDQDQGTDGKCATAEDQDTPEEPIDFSDVEVSTNE